MACTIHYRIGNTPAQVEVHALDDELHRIAERIRIARTEGRFMVFPLPDGGGIALDPGAIVAVDLPL
jgi:hypothetical protein